MTFLDVGDIMDKLKIQHHIKHLQEQHEQLEREILEQQKHYGEDRLVTILKKKKLKVKDEIEDFKKQLDYGCMKKVSQGKNKQHRGYTILRKEGHQ